MNRFYDLDGKEDSINVGYKKPQHDMGFSSTGPVCAANVSNGKIDSRPSASRSTRIVRSSKFPTALFGLSNRYRLSCHRATLLDDLQHQRAAYAD